MGAEFRVSHKRRGLSDVGGRSCPNRARMLFVRTGRVGSAKNLRENDRFTQTWFYPPRPAPSPPPRPPWLCAHLVQKISPQPGARPGSPVRVGAHVIGIGALDLFITQSCQTRNTFVLASKLSAPTFGARAGRVLDVLCRHSISKPPLLRSQVTSHRWHQGNHPPPLRRSPARFL